MLLLAGSTKPLIMVVNGVVDEKGPLGFSPWNGKNDGSKYTSGIAGGAPACTTAGFDVYGSVGVVIGGAGCTVGADRFDFP